MTRRRSTARRTPARGGQQGYEPPVTRMRRDERLLELALERWSQRQIAADVGLTQGGVSKASPAHLHATVGHHDAGDRSLSDQAGAAGGAPGAGQPGRGTRRSQADVTTRRQRKVAAGGGAAATTVVELETQSRRGQSELLGGGTAVRRVRREAARLVRLPRTPSWRGATGPRSGHRQRPPRRPPLVRPH